MGKPRSVSGSGIEISGGGALDPKNRPGNNPNAGEIVTFRGRQYRQIPGETPGIGWRIGAFFTSAIAAATAPVAYPAYTLLGDGSWEKYKAKTGMNTLMGKPSRPSLTPLPKKTNTELRAEYGYDRTQRSMTAFLRNNPEHTLYSEGGHQYYIDQRNSVMILLENGDINKPRFIYLHTPSASPDPENREGLKSKEIKRAAKAFVRLYDTIKEQGGDKCAMIVFNPNTKMLYGYDERPDDSVDITDEVTGRWFTVSDESWKDVAELWDPNKTEGKDDLNEKVDRKSTVKDRHNKVDAPRKDTKADDESALRHDLDFGKQRDALARIAAANQRAAELNANRPDEKKAEKLAETNS